MTPAHGHGLAALVGRAAVDRLRHPAAVDGSTMLAVALVAFVANVGAVLHHVTLEPESEFCSGAGVPENWKASSR